MSKPRLLELQLFSEEETVETNQVETEVVETEEVAEQVEEFDEIDYNKEVVKIPVSERKAYLQKGYNYDKVLTKKQELEQQLDSNKDAIDYMNSFIKEQGFDSFKEYKQALELENIKKETGLDEAKAMELMMGREALAYKEQVQQKEQTAKQQEEALQQTIAEFQKNFPDAKIESLPEEVLEMYSNNVDLSIAYELYQLRQGKTKIEQETLKKLKHNESASVGSASSGASETGKNYGNMSESDFKKLQAEVLRKQ